MMNWDQARTRWLWSEVVTMRHTMTQELARCLLLALREHAHVVSDETRATSGARLLERLVCSGRGAVVSVVFSMFRDEQHLSFYGMSLQVMYNMMGPLLDRARRNRLSPHQPREDADY